MRHPPVQNDPQSIASATDESTIFGHCTVNGYHVKALIDTGASVTITHTDLFARVRDGNTLLRQSERNIVGANNMPLNVVGVAETEKLFGGASVKHDVLVCDDLAQMLLIGVDFLKPHNCRIDFEKGTIRVRGKDSQMTFEKGHEV